jgi:transposase
VTRIICGVDISSSSLAARIGRSGAQNSFANTPEGIASLAAFCRHHSVDLVAMEATGGYEQQSFAQLWEQGLPVALLNPRAVRSFAQAMGLFEKTDAIDAGVIAWFAEARNSSPSQPAAASQQRLRGLVTRFRQLTAIRTAQRNQSRLITDPTVLASFAELLHLLKRQMQELETAIAQLIAQDPLWQQLDPVFRAVKGVADRTIARLMAEMPEIGTLSHKAISKLAGVAARYEPDFIAFRARLAAAGKPPKVIRIALAHKLLVRLNAKARDVRQQLAQTPQQLIPAPVLT